MFSQERNPRARETYILFYCFLMLILFFQAELEVEEIPVIQFAPPFSTLQVNTIDNVGFCMENEGEVDWKNCIKVETENSFFLNLTDCFSQDGYRGTCMDGTQNIAR